MNLTPFHGPPATPPVVPGFAAHTLLGFGAHGEVWLAEDLTTGSGVALKVGRRAVPELRVPAGVPPGAPAVPAEPQSSVPIAAVGEPAAAGVERETALLCRIDHPHVVRLQRVVPFGQAEIALVLDLAAGGSLASLVAARGRFDPGEVTTMLIPLANALEYLHRRGLVHGDLAPGNVLFTAEGRPQLSDLGVARILGTRTSHPWATPGFTDPSRTADGRPIDARAADVWGLAAVGWFALTGRPPELDVLAESDVCALAPALTALLIRCLGADPDTRPDVDELADLAWQAARPVPVRLVTESGSNSAPAGLLSIANRVTRPVLAGPVVSADGAVIADLTSAAGRSGSAADQVEPAAGQPGSLRIGSRLWVGLFYQLGRLGRVGQRFRVPVAVGSVIVAVGLSSTAAALLRPEGASSQAVRSLPSPSARPGIASATSAAGLDGELGAALEQIGRARAAAFADASMTRLAEADETGSPAYRSDAALVRRLRTRGFRLQGVHYAVRGVHVLRRIGQSVDVAAVVTTSVHLQVGVTSRISVPVPEDGPRQVVFTVVRLGAAKSDPGRWRVRDVEAPT